MAACTCPAWSPSHTGPSVAHSGRSKPARTVCRLQRSGHGWSSPWLHHHTAAAACLHACWHCRQHAKQRSSWPSQASSSAMAGDSNNSTSSGSNGSLDSPSAAGSQDGNAASSRAPTSNSGSSSTNVPSDKLNSLRTADGLASSEETCLIESRQSVKDFSSLQLDEINQSISNRRNRIFLLMEEVRRLRIQQRIKGGERTREEEVAQEEFPSVIPLLPPLTKDTWNEYLKMYLSAVAVLIVFGGLLAPAMELRMGVGGTSYADFVHAMHLPSNLAAVDPIVAAFCGGAVGVLSALLVLEANNAKVGLGVDHYTALAPQSFRVLKELN